MLSLRPERTRMGTVGDYSDLESRIDVHGEVLHDQYRVLTVTGASVPNTLASLLLDIRDRTGVRPHIYFEWTEGNPARHLLRFLLFGVGEVAPSLVRSPAEPNPTPADGPTSTPADPATAGTRRPGAVRVLSGEARPAGGPRA
jgi:hypothetical protein